MTSALAIAGFDPSSGAGVTADLMVFAAHGLFGTACITALTVQNTIGVFATHPVAAPIVTATLDRLCADIPPTGIKIGMLATAETVLAVAGFVRMLRQHTSVTVVLDPVLRSSSGRELLDPAGVDALRDELLPLVDWVTPNADELGVLLRRKTTPGEAELPGAAAELQQLGRDLTVVVTGGDLDPPTDLLLSPGSAPQFARGKRIQTTSTHGTGCAFSSALLSRLLLGDTGLPAVQLAKNYVAEAMRSAAPIGSGHGPMNHLWTLRKP